MHLHGVMLKEAQKKKLYSLGACAKLRKTSITFVMLVCPSEWNNWAPTAQIWVKFYFIFEFFFRNSFEKIQVSSKSDKNKATLYEEQYAFLSYLAQFF
jgi:hypothetical protein